MVASVALTGVVPRYPRRRPHGKGITDHAKPDRQADWTPVDPGTAGALGVLGGLLWVGALLAEYRFDLFPPGGGAAYVADQLAFALAMLCYIAVLLGLRRSGAPGSGRGARMVVLVWAVGWALAFVGLVSSLIAPDFPAVEVLPALGGLVTGIFGLTTGALVARAGVWRGWPRWVPLVLALYALFALFVPLFMGAEPSLLTEAGWALGYALLGAALRSASTRP